MSAANASADSYRRARSFSIDFSTIQSSSPRSDDARRFTSMLRESASDGSASRDSVIFADGGGASTSPIIRRMSDSTARWNVSVSYGVVPVSSS